MTVRSTPGGMAGQHQLAKIRLGDLAAQFDGRMVAPLQASTGVDDVAAGSATTGAPGTGAAVRPGTTTGEWSGEWSRLTVGFRSSSGAGIVLGVDVDGRVHCRAVGPDSQPWPRPSGGVEEPTAAGAPHGRQGPSGEASGGDVPTAGAWERDATGIPDEPERCPLCFSAPTADIVAALAQVPMDVELAGRFQVSDRGAGGSWDGPLPPLDLAVVEGIDDLPVVTGATVTAQMALTGSPVGPIAYLLTLVDGKLADLRLGGRLDADVLVCFRYDDYLLLRSGRQTAAEALRRGDVAGDLAHLQVLSGLVQSPPFAAAYRRGFTGIDALVRTSRVLDHPSFRTLATEARRHLGLGTADQNP